MGLWGNPPPSGDPELLEAPKAPKQCFGLNRLAPKAPEKICDWLKTRRKQFAKSLKPPQRRC